MIFDSREINSFEIVNVKYIYYIYITVSFTLYKAHGSLEVEGSSKKHFMWIGGVNNS